MEIEAKIAVADHQGVLEALTSAGAELVGAFVQTDRFFDFADGRLRKGDSTLRLRVMRPMGKASQPAQNLLTYKGSRQEGYGGLKVRQEIETFVEDAGAMAEILRASGMVLSLTVQKRRTSYLLGGYQVELDELPLLGRFVEVEGPDAEAIHAVLRRLGLKGEMITKSYVGLLAKKVGELKTGAEYLLEG